MPSQSVASANASFEDDWRPEQYLASYYRSVQPDEQATVHHLFPFARSAHMIHVAGYLECDLGAVADWMTGAPDCHDWSCFVSLVEPGGRFVFTALRNAVAYRVGDSMFPSAGVTEFDVAEVLRSEGFSRGDLSIEVADVVDEKNHGVSSVIFAIGRRR